MHSVFIMVIRIYLFGVRLELQKHVAELSCLTFRPTTYLPIRSLLARSRVGPCFPASFPVCCFSASRVAPFT